jgi:hypothetical protein
MVARTTSLNSLRQGVRGAIVRLPIHLMIRVSICFAMIFTNTSMVKSRPFARWEASCAAEAQKLFQEEGQDANINPLTLPIAPVSRRYQSHYNNILKKCLMLLEATQYGADQIATFVTLIDVDDRHLYAFYLYLWSARKDKRGLLWASGLTALRWVSCRSHKETRAERHARPTHCGQSHDQGRSAADRGQHRQAAGAVEKAIARELLQLTPPKRLGSNSRQTVGLNLGVGRGWWPTLFITPEGPRSACTLAGAFRLTKIDKLHQLERRLVLLITARPVGETINFATQRCSK